MSIALIKQIEFGVLSTDEIKQLSACEFKWDVMPGEYQRSHPGIDTTTHTAGDKRMGLVDNHTQPCITCGLTVGCQGHFGHMNLAKPIVHPTFKTLLTIPLLKIFCHNCYRLCLKAQLRLDGITQLSGQKRLSALVDCKTAICEHCNSPIPTITTDDDHIYKVLKNARVLLTPEDIFKIFNNISDEDVAMCGFNPEMMHPRNLIMSTLIVPPSCIRPYIYNNGNINNDDLTLQLNQIVKKNNILLNPPKEKENGKDKGKPKDPYQIMIRYISCMYNNDPKSGSAPTRHPSGRRPYQCIKNRISGKKALFRLNLMGKRVDYSARTVIGAGPYLNMNQIGLPEKIARTITKPERVTSFNIDWIKQLYDRKMLLTIKKSDTQKWIRFKYIKWNQNVALECGDIIVRNSPTKLVKKNGYIHIPADAEIIHVINNKYKVQEGDYLIRDNDIVPVTCNLTHDIKIEIGDTVERFLQNGDIVFFNRQPTLHRGSMMAMEVVITKHKTIQVNLAVTQSYNADFDGDEIKCWSQTADCY